MKRFWAAVIDFVICYILSKIFFGWIWDMLKGIHGADLQSLSKMTVREIRFVVSFSAYFFYSFLFDRLSSGNTPGRDIVGCQFKANGEIEDNWRLKHSFFKAIAAKLWFITAIYYFITFKMPYDNLIDIGGEWGIHFIEKEKRKDQYAGKRIVAMLIDTGIMMMILLVAAFVIACYTFLMNGGRKTNIRISLSGIYSLICFFVYFFVMELIFGGSSIGKKIMGIRFFAEGEKIDCKRIFIHSVLKAVAFFLWPISLIYCLITGGMYYDEWVDIRVSNGEKRYK